MQFINPDIDYQEAATAYAALKDRAAASAK